MKYKIKRLTPIRLWKKERRLYTRELTVETLANYSM